MSERTCSIPGCPEPPRRKKAKWCDLHYGRWRRHGDPQTLLVQQHGYAKHGKKTPEYSAWQGMKRRCYVPSDRHYGGYGGRGITVYPEWLSDFSAFLTHVGPRPGPDYSLDRIDNDGNYEPGNVRWATREQQQRNTRARERITWRGESLLAAEWAERTGIPAALIFQRIWRGWSVEQALTTPARTTGPRQLLTWRGETRLVAEWADRLGIPRYMLYRRLWKGWDVERALTTPPQRRGRRA